MVAFALCLLFNAHPDLWLPEPAFSEKYFEREVKYIRRTEDYRDSLLRLAAEEPRRAARLQRAIDDFARRIDRERERLAPWQATQRLALLLNFDPVSRRRE
jgi:hypothetical protein